MTSPAEPLGGTVLAGTGGIVPPPAGTTADEPVTAVPTATMTSTSVQPAGQSSASMPTTATATAAATVTSPATGVIPAYDHVVMVLLENHGYTQIIGSSNAPYINSQVSASALFTNSHGGPDVLHPSFPNYIQLFSGGTQGVTNDNCPPAGQPFSVASLASVLIAAGKTFGGYAQSAPAGFTACGPSPYAGRHVPWVWFSSVPQSVHHDFTAFPQTAGGWATLPTVSIVVPDLAHDMHSFGTETDAQTIQAGDTWIQANLDGYAQWAKTHNSLYIIQFDEDNFTTADHIPTMFIGQHVKAGQYGELVNHYIVLRTLADMFGAARPGKSAQVNPIIDCWN